MRDINLPIYQVVIFKDANRSLQFDETEIPIIGPQELPHYIRTRPREDAILNPKQMKKLINNLLNSHREYNPFPITTKYFINPNEIITGVNCNKCHTFAVKKLFREWRCQICGDSSKTAHLTALNDYAMLINRKINNKECRRFLHIETCKQASVILKSLKTDSTGPKKKHEYMLPYATEKK